MPFVHGRQTRLLVNGHDLSAYFQNVDVDASAELIDTTTFQAAAKQFLLGYRDGKISCQGLYESKADAALAIDRNAVDDILAPLLGADTNQLVLIAQDDLTAGSASATTLQAKTLKYSITSPYNGAVSCMAEMQATEAGVRSGIALNALSTPITATSSGAAQDNTAATTTGGVAQVHVKAATGTTPSLTAIIEDSADGTTGWATVGTFAAQTAVGAAAMTIAGTIRRYVRASFTVSGTTPSFSAVVVLSRNS